LPQGTDKWPSVKRQNQLLKPKYAGAANHPKKRREDGRRNKFAYQKGAGIQVSGDLLLHFSQKGLLRQPLISKSMISTIRRNQS
jgi:hypothetical protein